MAGAKATDCIGNESIVLKDCNGLKVQGRNQMAFKRLTKLEMNEITPSPENKGDKQLIAGNHDYTVPSLIMYFLDHVLDHSNSVIRLRIEPSLLSLLASLVFYVLSHLEAKYLCKYLYSATGGLCEPTDSQALCLAASSRKLFLRFSALSIACLWPRW